MQSVHRPVPLLVLLAAVCLSLAACAGTPTNPNPRAAQENKLATVDLTKYMGRWYIIANIPYFGEKGYVASQSEWKLREDGKIDDAYIGRKGGFDAPETRREFVDTVLPGTGNAHWRVPVFWLISVSQLTLYVDPMYQYTVLGYPDKSYGWIFARTPYITEAKYQELLGKLDEQGYDISRLRRVPQQREQMGKPGFHTPGMKD
ncbi:MAG: lipocalin family protein [Burkholderiaceae bacterium]